MLIVPSTLAMVGPAGLAHLLENITLSYSSVILRFYASSFGLLIQSFVHYYSVSLFLAPNANIKNSA